MTLRPRGGGDAVTTATAGIPRRWRRKDAGGEDAAKDAATMTVTPTTTEERK